MCKAPKPPKPVEPKKPQFLRNKYLDAFTGGSGAVSALKQGRSQLRVPMASEGTPASSGSALGQSPPPVQPNPVVNPIAPIGPRRGRPNQVELR
jgi:hypothetical protein